MEIYEIKSARIGVDHPSVLDPVTVLVNLRQRLEMGGLSFCYTAEAFGDENGQCEGHPLVIKYVPYTKNIELPKLKKNSSSSIIGGEMAVELQKRSRKSMPAVAAMIRRTSNGGFVNGWPVIRPETGAVFDDPFRGDERGSVQSLDADTPGKGIGSASPVAYRGRKPRNDAKLSGTGASVAAAIAGLRSGASIAENSAESLRVISTRSLIQKSPMVPNHSLIAESAST